MARSLRSYTSQADREAAIIKHLKNSASRGLSYWASVDAYKKLKHDPNDPRTLDTSEGGT